MDKKDISSHDTQSGSEDSREGQPHVGIPQKKENITFEKANKINTKMPIAHRVDNKDDLPAGLWYPPL